MIKVLSFLILIIVFASSSGSIYAQHLCASEKSCKAHIILNPLSGSPDTIPVDTNIRNFYYPEIFHAQLLFPATTGTSGRPAFDLFRHLPSLKTDYLYHNPYQHYQINVDNIEIIRSDEPFSEWYYLMGAHREQIFRATHAQNAGTALNFGMDLQFINNRGAYQHEHSKVSHLAIYGQYRDAKLPLESDLFVFFNSATSEENGGIADPSYFEDTTAINRQLVPVFLHTPVRNHRSVEVLLRNKWFPNRLTKKINANDQEEKDTINPKNKNFPNHFSLDFKFKRAWWLYQDLDPLNPWYPEIRRDSLQTFDSLSTISFAADIAYNIQAWDKIKVSAGTEMKIYSFYDTITPDGNAISFRPYTKWRFNPLRSLDINAMAFAIIDSEFGAAHQIDILLNWKSGKKYSISLGLSDRTVFPFRQDLMFESNHYYWNNDFVNQHITQLKPSISFNGKFPLKIQGSVSRINNFIYYDKFALPHQHDDVLLFYQLMVSGKFDLKRFVFDGLIALQSGEDELNILRQPVALGRIMSGYKFSLFDGKLDAIGGIVFNGRSSAYVDAFNPVSGIFHHNSHSRVKEYFWADPFLTILLKKTRFMVRYENASAWLTGYGYYSVPGYPITDPVLRFSVAWRFMD